MLNDDCSFLHLSIEDLMNMLQAMLVSMTGHIRTHTGESHTNATGD
mgnify:CR=1 FL=1